jgi:hypothetical protein
MVLHYCKPVTYRRYDEKTKKERLYAVLFPYGLTIKKGRPNTATQVLFESQLGAINEIEATLHIPLKKGTTGKANNAPTWKKMYDYFEFGNAEFLEMTRIPRTT